MTVVEQVTERRSSCRYYHGEAASRSRRHLLELRSIQITQQQRALRPGRAPVLQINSRIHVPIGHENVEQPVVIVVEKAGAPAQKWDRQRRDSSAKSDVGERRVAFIPVKRVVIVGEIRDVKIDFAITVVIADCNS